MLVVGAAHLFADHGTCVDECSTGYRGDDHGICVLCDGPCPGRESTHMHTRTQETTFETAELLRKCLHNESPHNFQRPTRCFTCFHHWLPSRLRRVEKFLYRDLTSAASLSLNQAHEIDCLQRFFGRNLHIVLVRVPSESPHVPTLI